MREIIIFKYDKTLITITIVGLHVITLLIGMPIVYVWWLLLSFISLFDTLIPVFIILTRLLESWE